MEMYWSFRRCPQSPLHEVAKQTQRGVGALADVESGDAVSAQVSIDEIVLAIERTRITAQQAHGIGSTCPYDLKDVWFTATEAASASTIPLSLA